MAINATPGRVDVSRSFDAVSEKDKDIENGDVEAIRSPTEISTAIDWYPNAAEDPANPWNWPQSSDISQIDEIDSYLGHH